MIPDGENHRNLCRRKYALIHGFKGVHLVIYTGRTVVDKVSYRKNSVNSVLVIYGGTVTQLFQRFFEFGRTGIRRAVLYMDVTDRRKGKYDILRIEFCRTFRYNRRCRGFFRLNGIRSFQVAG